MERDAKTAAAFDVDEVRRGFTCFGLPLGWGQFGATRAAQEVALGHAGVSLVLRGAGRGRVDIGRQQFDVQMSPGMLGISENGLVVRQGRYCGSPGEVIRIQFPEHSMSEILRDDSPGFQLRTHYEAFDERMAWLMKSIWENQAGEASNALYAEGLVLALLGLLRQRFGQPLGGRRKTVGEFDARTRKRLVEFIEQGLGEALSIPHLAQEARMSPQHFARVFARTFGQPPHAYVMSSRIAAARRSLMEDPERTISDIAMSLGFSNPAHFSKRFKEAVGTTPAKWRQQ